MRERAVLLATVLLALVLLTGTALAASIGMIAFVSDREGGVNQIFLMKEDGTRLANITGDKATNQDPDLSSDGKRIVFASSASGSMQIWVMDVNGKDRKQLTTDKTVMNWGPSWSPDGKRIVFVSVRDGNSQLYIMNADGSHEFRLDPSKDDQMSPKWSPDGKKIAFVTSKGGNKVVGIVDLQPRKVTYLTKSEENSQDVAWAPDSKRLAYVAYDPRNRSSQVIIIGIDGKRLGAIRGKFNSTLQKLAWAPDGKRIAYVTDEDGSYQIVVSELNGSHRKQLTKGNNSTSPSWR